MWRCKKCERVFKVKNQSHTCTNIDMGELFLGKPDALVLALDKLLIETSNWMPNEVGVAKNTIVFTSKKAWLIVRPMKNVLDIKFYYSEELESDIIHKRSPWSNKFAHHIRVENATQLNQEVFELLRKGFDYSL